jgi:hypothetical protein
MEARTPLSLALRARIRWVSSALVFSAGLHACGGSESPAGASNGGRSGSSSDASAETGAGAAQGGAAGGGSGGISAGGAAGASGSAGASGVAGTSGNTGTDGGAPDASSMTKYAACADYVNATCNRLYRECSGLPAVADPCPDFLNLCPDFLFSDGSNRTIDEVLSCAAVWRTYSCDQVSRGLFPKCGRTGQRAVGQPCVYGSQCASGRCGGAPLDATSPCGVCAAVVNAGDQCGSFQGLCPNGYECSSGGTCTPLPIFNLPAGAACERLGQCLAGYLCLPEGNDGGTLQCRPTPKLGDACTGYCEEEAVCSSSRCVPAPGAGEACASGYTCNAQSACDREALPAPVCRARKAIGERCKPDKYLFVNVAGDCQKGLMCFCDDASCSGGTCYVRRFLGESCTGAGSHCVLGTECRQGTCVALDSQGLADRCR